MKITALQLKKIIKEETRRVLVEEGKPGLSRALADAIEEGFSGLLFDLQANSWDDPRVVDAVQRRVAALIPSVLRELAKR